MTRQPDEDDAVRRWRAWSGDGQSEVDVDDRRPARFAPGEGESSDEDDRAEPSEGRRPRTGALGAALPAPAAPSRTTEATTAAPTAWTARGMGMVGVVLILALVLVGSLLGLHRQGTAAQAGRPSLAPAVVPTQPVGQGGQGDQPTGAASVSGHPLLNLLSDVIPKERYTEDTPYPTTIEASESVPISTSGRTPEMLMADGDSRTAWQTQGDGTGRQITVEFPQQRTVTQVGLINGDADGAKYAAERRILKVRWTFDDGRSVIQTLRDGDPEPQVIGISAEITTNIHITLLEVSDSTSVEDDYTAISELRLSGWVD